MASGRLHRVLVFVNLSWGHCAIYVWQACVWCFFQRNSPFNFSSFVKWRDVSLHCKCSRFCFLLHAQSLVVLLACPLTFFFHLFAHFSAIQSPEHGTGINHRRMNTTSLCAQMMGALCVAWTACRCMRLPWILHPPACFAAAWAHVC